MGSIRTGGEASPFLSKIKTSCSWQLCFLCYDGEKDSFFKWAWNIGLFHKLSSIWYMNWVDFFADLVNTRAWATTNYTTSPPLLNPFSFLTGKNSLSCLSLKMNVSRWCFSQRIAICHWKNFVRTALVRCLEYLKNGKTKDKKPNERQVLASR